MKKYAFDELFPKDKKFLCKGKARKYDTFNITITASLLACIYIFLLIYCLVAVKDYFSFFSVILALASILAAPFILIMLVFFVTAKPYENIEFAFDDKMFYYRKDDNSNQFESCRISSIVNLKKEKKRISFEADGKTIVFPHTRNVNAVFSYLKETVSNSKKHHYDDNTYKNITDSSVFSTITGYRPENRNISDSSVSDDAGLQNKKVEFKEETW